MSRYTVEDEAVFKAARSVVDIIKEPRNVQVERLRKALAERDSPVPSDEHLGNIALDATGIRKRQGTLNEFRAIYAHACRDCSVALGNQSELSVLDCIDLIDGMATVMEER
jgi:hypothetical protein